MVVRNVPKDADQMNAAIKVDVLCFWFVFVYYCWIGFRVNGFAPAAPNREIPVQRVRKMQRRSYLLVGCQSGRAVRLGSGISVCLQCSSGMYMSGNVAS